MVNHLKNFREDADLTAKEVAKVFSTTEKTIYNWESGHSEPNMEQLCKLSEIYQATVDDLIGNTNIKKTNLTEAEKELIKETIPILQKLIK